MNMKRFLTRGFSVFLVFLLMFFLTGLNAIVYSAEIDKFSTQLSVQDFSGNRELAIRLVYLNEQTMKHFWEDQEQRENLKSVIGERDCLLVASQAFQDTYFYPTRIQFTQNNRQYNIDHNDVIKITETFSGQLRKDSRVAGLIFIPEQIDIHSKMKIHYEDNYASLSVPGETVEEKNVEEKIQELEKEKRELQSELERINDRLSEIESKLKKLRSEES